MGAVAGRCYARLGRHLEGIIPKNKIKGKLGKRVEQDAGSSRPTTTLTTMSGPSHGQCVISSVYFPSYGP
jgi:hypothetical protein